MPAGNFRSNWWMANNRLPTHPMLGIDHIDLVTRVGEEAGYWRVGLISWTLVALQVQIWHCASVNTHLISAFSYLRIFRNLQLLQTNMLSETLSNYRYLPYLGSLFGKKIFAIRSHKSCSSDRKWLHLSSLSMLAINPLLSSTYMVFAFHWVSIFQFNTDSISIEIALVD